MISAVTLERIKQKRQQRPDICKYCNSKVRHQKKHALWRCAWWMFAVLLQLVVPSKSILVSSFVYLAVYLQLLFLIQPVIFIFITSIVSTNHIIKEKILRRKFMHIEAP